MPRLSSLIDGCIIIIHEAVTCDSTKWNSNSLWRLDSKKCYKLLVLKRKKPSLKALITKLLLKASLYDIQSHSLDVKLLDFAPFVVCRWGNSSYHTAIQ